MSKEVSEAESRVNTKVSDAQSAMQKTEDAMNTAVEQMNKRLDANVTASTDAKAIMRRNWLMSGLGRMERCIRPLVKQSVGSTVWLWRMGSPEQSWHLPVPMVIWVRCSQRLRCRLCWGLNVKQENFWITGHGNYGLRSVLPSLYQYANGQIPKISVHLQDSGDFRLLCRCELLSVRFQSANLNTHVTKAIRVAHGSESLCSILRRDSGEMHTGWTSAVRCKEGGRG